MSQMPLRALGLLLAATSFMSIAYAESFADITGSPHATAVQYLQTKGLIAGYDDNTFRPDHTINRAAFMKLLVSLTSSKDTIESCLKKSSVSFSDVPKGSWFAPYVCVGIQKKFISGTSNRFFSPDDPLTVADASAALARAFSLPISGTGASPWYAPYVASLAAARAIPSDVGSPQQYATRGQVADMLWRLDQKMTDQPAAFADALLNAKCLWFTQDQIPQVDIQEVRRVWISWMNDARAQQNLPPYQEDKQLDYSATLWSLQADQKGTISHKRPGVTAYYDYAAIKNWFGNLQIDFANIDRQTFSENIGWGVYSCAKDDCTQTLIDALRTTFDFYMSEKGKASDAHYRSIMDPEFQLVGVGVSVDASSGKYYVTTHYGTSITSDPQPICP